LNAKDALPLEVLSDPAPHTIFPKTSIFSPGVVVPIPTLLLAWVMAEFPIVEVPVNKGTVLAVPPVVVTVVWAARLAARKTHQRTREILAVTDPLLR
jgi:hypothetical protein